MATFQNQATLIYGGNVTTSNIVTGELQQAVSAAKYALGETYTQGREQDEEGKFHIRWGEQRVA